MWTSHKVKCSCDSIYSYINSHKLLCSEIKFLKTKDFFSNVEADNNISKPAPDYRGVPWKLFQHLQIRLIVRKGELTFSKKRLLLVKDGTCGLWYQKQGFPIIRPIVCNIYWWFPAIPIWVLRNTKMLTRGMSYW